MGDLVRVQNCLNLCCLCRFTALGSLYFLHESWRTKVEIYDFQVRPSSYGFY